MYFGKENSCRMGKWKDLFHKGGLFEDPLRKATNHIIKLNQANVQTINTIT